MSSNIVLSELREELMTSDDELSLISDKDRIFRGIFSSVSPITFEQFSYDKENKVQAEMIRKAFDYYISKIEYIKKVKNDIKNNKFLVKDLFVSIGKKEKTIYNQKEKYSLFFDFVDALNDKYQFEASIILKAYLKPSKASGILETAERTSSAELSRRLIEQERENKKLIKVLDEIKYLIYESNDLKDFENKANKLFKKVEDIKNGNV